MLPGTGKPAITLDQDTIKEAEKLHDAIPPSNWCVTREDLARFRTLVKRSWHQGHIKRNVADYAQIPTAEQAVKRHNDPLVGPSMYQVNDHFIMPVTAEAGGMSWALMCCIQAAIKGSRRCFQRSDELLEGESWALKQYKALKQKSGVGDDPKSIRSWLQASCVGSRQCDTFITHGWAEGVFEFCDNVLGSLPNNCRNLWICFFANPQNLKTLLKKLVSGEVDESPFALALQTCSLVLVVPNGAQSIYGRIWCVYEAYSAYHASKRAIKPIQMTVARVVRKKTLCITSIKLMAAFTLMLVVALFGFGIAIDNCDGVDDFHEFRTSYAEHMLTVELFYVVVCVPYVTIRAVGGPLIPRINVFIAFMLGEGTAATRIHHCMLHVSQCIFPLFNMVMVCAAGLTLAKPWFLFGCNFEQHAQSKGTMGEGRTAANQEFGVWLSKDTVEPCSAIFFFFPLLAWGSFREVWVQLAAQGKAQLGLPCGDTVRNAESSCHEDKERILEKIADDIDDVNQTVRILQEDGCCNGELHEAANVGVDTSGALTEAGCCMRTMQKLLWAAIAIGLYMDYHVASCETPRPLVIINNLTIFFVVLVSWVVPCFSWSVHVCQSCSCSGVTVHRRFAGYSLFVGAVLTCTSLLVVEGLWGVLHSYKYGTASAINTSGKQLFCYDVVTLIFSIRASMKAIAGPTSQWSRSITSLVKSQLSLRNLRRMGSEQQLDASQSSFV